MGRLCKLRTEFELRLNDDSRHFPLDHFFIRYRLVGVALITSIILMIALSAILYFNWDKLTEEFSDRKIEKFFEDQDGN